MYDTHTRTMYTLDMIRLFMIGINTKKTDHVSKNAFMCFPEPLFYFNVFIIIAILGLVAPVLDVLTAQMPSDENETASPLMRYSILILFNMMLVLGVVGICIGIYKRCTEYRHWNQPDAPWMTPINSRGHPIHHHGHSTEITEL